MRPCPRCGTAIGNKAPCCEACVGKPLAMPFSASHSGEWDLDTSHLEDDETSDDFEVVALTLGGLLVVPLAVCYFSFGAGGVVAALALGIAMLVGAWGAMGGGF